MLLASSSSHDDDDDKEGNERIIIIKKNIKFNTLKVPTFFGGFLFKHICKNISPENFII